MIKIATSVCHSPHGSRHRKRFPLSVCERLCVPYKTILMDFADRDAAALWGIDNQSLRRNLSPIDRITLASRREDVVRRLAAGNRVEAGWATGRGNFKIQAKMPRPLSTQAVCANSAGSGKRAYDAGKLALAG